MIKKPVQSVRNNKGKDEDSESFMARAANVLSCLSEGLNTLTDIAKRCNVSASTAHRLLATLARANLVIYDPIGHRYYLGPRVAKLAANPVTSHQCLIMACNNEMERLSHVVEETITLSLMLGIRYVPLHSVFSSHRLIVLEEFTGVRPVIPVGATDLVLLSMLDEKDLKQTLAIGNTWQGKKDPGTQEIESLTRQLSLINQQGYIVTRGEKVHGSLGVAAPIKNYICPVAITLIGSEYRLDPRLSDLTKEIAKSSRQLSSTLLKIFPPNKA
jgi:DNA-binding IclR family transcriptional regulator